MLGLLSICIEYGLYTWLANREERVMQLIGNQNSLGTWVRPTEGIRVLTMEIQPIFLAYLLHT